ncbi:hypothetical protein [Pacificispira sp.]|uniref:hypothetical protein n=1 Tax=Pacificispira sp. TaxID=2888761 RepID=UPI003BABD8E2
MTFQVPQTNRIVVTDDEYRCEVEILDHNLIIRVETPYFHAAQGNVQKGGLGNYGGVELLIDGFLEDSRKMIDCPNPDGVLERIRYMLHEALFQLAINIAVIQFRDLDEAELTGWTHGFNSAFGFRVRNTLSPLYNSEGTPCQSANWNMPHAGPQR